MKYFIVDNGSVHINEMIRALPKGDDYYIELYHPNKKLNSGDADMIILSGGMKNEVYDNENGTAWFENEFNLIRTTDKPILGICLGLQMIVVALGGSLRELPYFRQERIEIELTKEGHKIFEDPIPKMYEAHRWVADSITNTGLVPLARSKDGIEIIFHPKRKILATQFHPEVINSEESNAIWLKILNATNGI